MIEVDMTMTEGDTVQRVSDLFGLGAHPIGGIARNFDGLDADLHDTIAPINPHKLTSYLQRQAIGEALEATARS